jgi:excinuclease UvrABC nuclease subunit
MSNPNHEKAQLALKQATIVELLFCKTEEAARSLEMKLIQQENPLYNEICRKSMSISSKTRNVHS